MRSLRAARRTPALLLAGLLLTAGCTDTDDSPSTPEAADPPSAQTSSSAPEPSPTSTTPAPTTSASPASLTDRLLATADVPGLNAQWQWQDGRTRPARSKPFGMCAQTAPGASLIDIGATEAVERTYFPPDDSDDNAAEQIAEFPDAKSATQAWAVLAAWRERCGRSVSADIDLSVRPLVSVPVSAGTARWYLLSWSPAGEETGRFEAFGMVRNGTRVAVLRMTNSGLDYNYRAGKEPMVGMVKAAADKLG
jgi:hypothetical protein